MELSELLASGGGQDPAAFAALNQRYGLEMDFDSVSGLVAAHGLVAAGDPRIDYVTAPGVTRHAEEVNRMRRWSAPGVDHGDDRHPVRGMEPGESVDRLAEPGAPRGEAAGAVHSLHQSASGQTAQHLFGMTVMEAKLLAHGPSVPETVLEPADEKEHLDLGGRGEVVLDEAANLVRHPGISGPLCSPTVVVHSFVRLPGDPAACPPESAPAGSRPGVPVVATR